MFLLFVVHSSASLFFLFFFNDPATTEIYTLSLHDALPISVEAADRDYRAFLERVRKENVEQASLMTVDRKSTRLNSSHTVISYAVFCLKKKKKKKKKITPITNNKKKEINNNNQLNMQATHR